MSLWGIAVRLRAVEASMRKPAFAVVVCSARTRSAAQSAGTPASTSRPSASMIHTASMCASRAHSALWQHAHTMSHKSTIAPDSPLISLTDQKILQRARHSSRYARIFCATTGAHAQTATLTLAHPQGSENCLQLALRVQSAVRQFMAALRACFE